MSADSGPLEHARDHINPYAGFRLLDKFQNQWRELHAGSERNISKAKGVLARIGSIEQSTSRSLHAANDFLSSLRSLSLLDEQIKSIDEDLVKLEDTFTRIEELLIALAIEKAERDTKQQIDLIEKNHENQAKELRCLSNVRREKLKMEHQQRVSAFELDQQKELEERRKILEQAFEEEKNAYLARQKQSN